MPTLFDPQARRRLQDRLDRLTPEHRPRWGTFTSPQMLCHVADQLRHGLGDLDAQPLRTPLARAPLNWLVIHLLPWPKGKAQSPPEFLARRPATWTLDVVDLNTLIERFGARSAEADWPDSPVFGRISGASWGVLAYRHLDHHFRQFRV
jgi:hypothetical protein